MLHKPRFVAETVVAVPPVAMEVRLVVPVATALEAAVLVETELQVASGYVVIPYPLHRSPLATGIQR